MRSRNFRSSSSLRSAFQVGSIVRRGSGQRFASEFRSAEFRAARGDRFPSPDAAPLEPVLGHDAVVARPVPMAQFTRAV